MNVRAIVSSAGVGFLLCLSACGRNPSEPVRKPEPTRGPLVVQRYQIADSILPDATGTARRNAPELNPGVGSAFLCVDIKVIDSGAMPPTIDLMSLKATSGSGTYSFVAFGLGEQGSEREIPILSHVLDSSGQRIVWSNLFSLQGEPIISGDAARLGKTEAFSLVFEVPAKTATFNILGIGPNPLSVGQADYYSVRPVLLKGHKLPATLGPGVVITARGNLLATTPITRSLFRGWVADVKGSPEMLAKLHAAQFDPQLDLEAAEDRARFIRRVVGVLGKEDASRATVRIITDRDRNVYTWPQPAVPVSGAPGR